METWILFRSKHFDKPMNVRRSDELFSLFIAAVVLIPLYSVAEDKAEVFPGKSIAAQLQTLAQTKASVAVELHSATMDRMQSHSQCEVRAAELKCMRTMMMCSW
jgi:hypothetical protein